MLALEEQVVQNESIKDTDERIQQQLGLLTGVNLNTNERIA
jgi:hypothetical protein